MTTLNKLLTEASVLKLRALSLRALGESAEEWAPLYERAAEIHLEAYEAGGRKDRSHKIEADGLLKEAQKERRKLSRRRLK